MSAATAIMPRINLDPPGRKEYEELVRQSLPHVIRSEAENEHYISLLESFHKRGNLTRAGKQFAELLATLIEQFEERHYALKAASPVEHLRELMKANGLRQKDLLGIFGSPSIVSEVLRGKRALTVAHIAALSRRFSVPADLFIEDV